MTSNLYKSILVCFCLVSLLFTPNLKSDVWILDINDTVTLLNEVDQEKTTPVVIGQLVAQNTYLENEPTKSLEQYIKETIANKTDQRKTYGDLMVFASELFHKQMISLESLLNMSSLHEKYRDAHLEASRPENAGFFPSLFALIDHILVTDSTPCICIQSFGNEIPHILKVLASRYEDFKVNQTIGVFDDQHNLVLDGKTYTGQDQLVSLLQPRTIVGWQNNYSAGGGKYLFFNTQSEPKLISRLFDDNAKRFARVYIDGKLLSPEEGLKRANRYIHQVDTAQALTKDSYFIQSIRRHFYYDEKNDTMILK